MQSFQYNLTTHLEPLNVQYLSQANSTSTQATTSTDINTIKAATLAEITIGDTTVGTANVDTPEDINFV